MQAIRLLALGGVMGAIVLAGSAMTAKAGPCSSDIAMLGKKLSSDPTIGGTPTTGTLTTSNPGSKVASPTAGGPSDQASTKGTTADKGSKLSGVAGTSEVSAASSQVATSAADVRRQQAGKPLMAADPSAGGSTGANNISRAKMELTRASTLDSRNDASCHQAVNQVKKLMGS